MRTILMLSALFVFSDLAIGQHPETRQNKREQIAAQKVAFITNRMQLSPDEAKIFWPVYDQYERELAELRKTQRERHKAAGGSLDSLNDAQVEEMIDAHIAMQEKEVKVRKRYHDQFKKLVGSRKVALLYKAEKDFQRELLQRYKQGKRGSEMKRPEEKRTP